MTLLLTNKVSGGKLAETLREQALTIHSTEVFAEKSFNPTKSVAQLGSTIGWIPTEHELKSLAPDSMQS
jgi:hypothetical protein